MAADSTLVRASLAESVSGAKVDVPNLKPLYDSTVKTMQAGQKLITGLIGEVIKQNETDRINKEKQLYGFNKIVDDTNFSLYQMDEPLPNKVVNAMRDGIKELKEEFELYNTYGKNDTEENNNARVRIMAELKKMTSQAVNTRAKFMEISDSYPDWNNARIKAGDIDALKSFLDIKNMDANENVSVSYSGGNLVFTNSLTGQSFTAKQMRDAMPIVDKKIQAYSVKQANTAITSAATAATNGDASIYDKKNINLYNSTRSKVIGDFLENVKLPEDYVNAATIPLLQNTQPLETALESYAPISIEVVKNMFYTKDGKVMPIGETFAMFDKDNDKDVDSDDFNMMKPEELEMFKANHKEMVNAIIRPDHPAFNLKVSKDILGGYYADLEEQAYTNQYNATADNVRKKNKILNSSELTLQPDTYYRVGTGGRELGSDIQSAYDKYAAGDSFNSYDDRFTFIEQDDGSYNMTGPTDPNKDGSFSGPIETRKISEFDIVEQMGFNKQAERLNFKRISKPALNPLPPPPPSPPPTNTDSSIPLPKDRGLFSSSFDTPEGSSKILGELYNLYKDYGDFKFEKDSGSLLITGLDGSTKRVSMSKKLGGTNAAKEIQSYISEQVNKEKQ